MPPRRPIEESRFVALCGEVFVRRDGFSQRWLDQRLAESGFILKKVHLTEWIWYLDRQIRAGVLRPNLKALGKVEMVVRRFYMPYSERRMKRLLAESGYYLNQRAAIDPLLDHGAHVISREFIGEPCMTVGTGMLHAVDHLCGVINIGPFGCMPVRLTEALLSPEMTIGAKRQARARLDPGYTLPAEFKDDMSIPFLTIETDGNPYPQVVEARVEAFAVQAERMYQLMRKHGTTQRER